MSKTIIKCHIASESDARLTLYLDRSRLNAHCSLLTARTLLRLWRQRQSEHRNHSLPRHIHLRFSGSRQIQRLAVFAAVDFGLRSPGFLHVAALALDGVGHVGPELQMAAAEFSLFVFLVAGALPGLLDLDLVVRELLHILGAGNGYFTGRQRTYPSFKRPERRQNFRPNAVIVT